MTSDESTTVSPPFPLDHEEFTLIRLWIHEWGVNKGLDQEMTEQCEEVLKKVFARNGLKLHESLSTSDLMSEIQFLLEPKSITVPMRFFAAD